MVMENPMLRETEARKPLMVLRRRSPRPTSGLSDAHLEEDIIVLVGRAQQYGIYGEHHLLVYIDLAFSVSARFDEHPLIRQILLDPQVDGPHKLSTIFARCVIDDWKQAARMDATAPGQVQTRI